MELLCVVQILLMDNHTVQYVDYYTYGRKIVPPPALGSAIVGRKLMECSAASTFSNNAIVALGAWNVFGSVAVNKVLNCSEFRIMYLL